MSKENHPNFHSIKFLVDIMNSSYECLRHSDHEVNSYVKRRLYDRLHEKAIQFALDVETEVDALAQEANG